MSSPVSVAQGQELLAALIGFIRPIAHVYAPSIHSDSLRNGAGLNNHPSGQRLLEALGEFITDITCTRRNSQEDSGKREPGEPEEIQPPSLTDVKVNNGVAPPFSPVTPISEYLKAQICDILGGHVFNKMPIRILAFDPTGSILQLIDRSEVYSRVLRNVLAEAAQAEFQSAWHKIQQMGGSVVVFAEVKGFIQRRAKEKQLITDLIERQARYAILSHTWMRDVPGDVVFRDWETRTSNPAGYNKVLKFCEVAAQKHGVAFGWLDTVCINKDSSSELDESIRSMYKWYRGAYICVSFMSQTKVITKMDDDSWFTRGWTLQELLAPRESQFYNSDWEDLGHITNGAVQAVIEKATTITKIELELCAKGEPHKIPISRRLQLAAKRRVTPEEDTAYSLMGLLGVDISIAYGEGSEHAFFRLVRELLTSKKDVLDVFNHGYYPSRKLIPSTILNYRTRSSVFQEPDYQGISQLSQWQPSEPIVLTHLGVRIPLLLVHALKVSKDDSQCAPIGDLSGTVRMNHNADFVYEFVEPHYSLLDRRIYTSTLATLGDTPGSGPMVITFGVLNFGVDGDDILIPRDCLFVPLDYEIDAPCIIRPTRTVKILDVSGSPVFEVKFDGKRTKVFKDHLQRHGAQLITLYL